MRLAGIARIMGQPCGGWSTALADKAARMASHREGTRSQESRFVPSLLGSFVSKLSTLPRRSFESAIRCWLGNNLDLCLAADFCVSLLNFYAAKFDSKSRVVKICRLFARSDNRERSERSKNSCFPRKPSSAVVSHFVKQIREKERFAKETPVRVIA